MDTTAVGGAGGPGSSPPGRPRIVLEDLAAEALDELPDVAREIRALRRILELGKRLTRIDEEGAFLDAFLEGANSVAGSERAFLVAPDGAGGAHVVRSRDLAGESREPRTIATPAAMRALQSREATLLPRAHEPGVPGEDPPPGVRAVLCVPVPGSEPRALYVDGRSDRDLFAASDADLLALYAEQAAAGLERVRLTAQNRRQRDELVAAGEHAERLNRRLAELLERRTLELRDVREDLERAGVDDAFRSRYPEIVGRGAAMSAVLRMLDRVADTGVPVLFEGESGTGKELMARALHASSRRSAGRFVAENCAALPETLLENELFGHERGAFTGADHAAPGLFERADGGTLFLDEVGDTSVALQKRLLRVLQEGEVRRVGGSSVRKVDVRIVTATNRDLRKLVDDGRFREDLYYRLAVVKLRVPPLRERREDLAALVHHFLVRAAGGGAATLAAGARPEVPSIAADAMDAFVAYDWPGNVRQLENEVRRAVALCRGGVIDRAALSKDLLDGPRDATAAAAGASLTAGRSLRDLVEDLETRVVREVIEREHGNITRAAEALGLSRLGLRKKLRRYGLVRD
ncbi:MAG: sigma-54-dependent Fis family transcriptional regulator [Planctomycetes bacterium]|nr:sigma-54-dependent Fis family transcriptional regulator [Planctomycetota bacterium]